MSNHIELYSDGVLNSLSDELSTWEELVDEHFAVITTLDGDIVVNEYSDGVNETYALIYALRDFADLIEERLKRRNVLVDDDKSVSVSRYLRGEY